MLINEHVLLAKITVTILHTESIYPYFPKLSNNMKRTPSCLLLPFNKHIMTIWSLLFIYQQI